MPGLPPHLRAGADLAGGRLIGIRSLLVVAAVLATTIPIGGTVAITEPTKLNIEKLIPEHPRPDYQRDVLDPLRQAQKAAAEKHLARQEQLEQKKSRAEKEGSGGVQTAEAPGDCYKAMRATWPEGLWAGATIVMQKESGATSNKIGPTLPDGSIGHNADGSQDFGCFQINSFAHKRFFQSHDWSDPYQNAAYAYQIYTGRGNWSAWYAVRGILY